MSAIYKDGKLYPTGGSGSSGHTILDNTGTSLTDEPNLKFGGDFEVSDDSENDETEVAPHRLTSEELADICSPLPASTSNLPVLFDESGAEYVVGRYVNSQGKWKPVYKKTIVKSSVINVTSFAHGLSNLEKILSIDCVLDDSNTFMTTGYVSNGNSRYMVYSDATNITFNGASVSGTLIATIKYTKTTDTYQD